MKQIKCFIASAFGYEDVDKMYDGSVIPVLNEFKYSKEISIKPLRVDRINHNEKIDVKIIELIKECDFGIVDLTYARPSVYYEAGFIEGLNKSVIYLAKSDHFRPKLNDTCGNERIHFDLVTKNIISWTTPNISFNQKLNSRINLIIKPIVQSNHISLKEDESKNEFLTMSLSERTHTIQNRVQQYFLNLKYIKFTLSRSNITEEIYMKKGLIVTVTINDTITQSSISFHKMGFSKNAKKDSSGFNILIFFSIKSVPTSRIEKALWNFKQRLDLYKVFENDNDKIIFLDSIDSILKLEKTLNNLSAILQNVTSK